MTYNLRKHFIFYFGETYIIYFLQKHSCKLQIYNQYDQRKCLFLLGLVSDRKACLPLDNLNIKSGCLCVYGRKQGPPCCCGFF